MITRLIPSSGEPLPVIGLGTWQQFDVPAIPDALQPLREVLQVMATAGGSLIDSSPMYGKAEEMTGLLTAGTEQSEHFFYATKVWTTGREAGIREMEDSMRKMRRPVLDLIQVHNLVDWKTQLRTLRQWKGEGRVRYLGITHYRSSAHEQLEQIIRTEPIDFVQFNYSIRTRDAERRLLDAAADCGTAVIINEPFEKGELFRQVRGHSLPPWAADMDIRNWAAFFLKYILAHPAVSCVIPGTSVPAHMLDNLSAGLGRLPDEAGREKMVQWLNGLPN